MTGAPSSDDDIDAMLGATIAKVGESAKVIALRSEVDSLFAEAQPVTPIVDPRSIPLRYSRLKAMAQSPAHYLLACQDDTRDTVAIRIGAGAHAGLFENRPVLLYPRRRQGKVWEAFEARCSEERAVVLNEREYEIARGVIDSVRRHRRAHELLFDGTVTEQTIAWMLAGRACSSTPDAASPRRQVELKSTRCSDPVWFAREAVRRYYHGQMAFYDRALATRGPRPDENFIVAVENVRPYNVTVMRLTDEAREVGDRLCQQWLERVAAAESAGVYGGYVDRDVDLDALEHDDENYPEIPVEVDGKLLTIEATP